MQEDHLITAPHTLAHWPQELYLKDPVIDRDNRETWQEKGSRELYDRACEQVERRLAAYEPIETDPAADEAMRALVTEGLDEQTELPDIPAVPEKTAEVSGGRRRGRRRRRPAENT